MGGPATPDFEVSGEPGFGGLWEIRIWMFPASLDSGVSGNLDFDVWATLDLETFGKS